MPVGSVARGVDIGSPDQHQAVELLYDFVGLGVGDLAFEQCRLLPACTSDGVEVSPRDHQRVGPPAGLVARSEARRDGDERAHGLSVYNRSKPLRSSQSVTWSLK